MANQLCATTLEKGVSPRTSSESWGGFQRRCSWASAALSRQRIGFEHRTSNFFEGGLCRGSAGERSAITRRRTAALYLFPVPAHVTPAKRMVDTQPGFPSSPPAFYFLASDGHSSQTTEVLESHMSFLRTSDLKRHLSTRSGNMTHHNEPPPTEGSRVILRDGNLITLPPSILEEEAVKTPEINLDQARR